jgi:hypothetical protein
MGIFERIKTAIFGRKPPATRPTSTPAAANTASRTPAAPSAPIQAQAPVDMEAIMKEYESKADQKLNWRTSIVDLLKLLDIDSSLENRKELAKELGYTGSTSDSAAMNIWLHKQVMRKLSESGGNVPASLLD